MSSLEVIEGRIARRLLGIVLLVLGGMVTFAVAWGQLNADVGRLKEDVADIRQNTQRPLQAVQRTLDSLVIELRHLNERVVK